MQRTPAHRRVLRQLLGATRGGPTRIRILDLIRDRPQNTNQIALGLHLDYKTVEHHIRVLRENQVIGAQTQGYGAAYTLTLETEGELDEFERIANDIFGPARASRHVEGAT